MLSLEVIPYTRDFQTPLKTYHGLWIQRRSILLRLTDPNGQVSYGEVVPLEAFGSETWEEAMAFCQELPRWISWEDIQRIPSELPATQAGLELIWQNILDPAPFFALPVCGLLPAGEKALEVLSSLEKRGYTTLKWKIGVYPFQQERFIFQCLYDRIQKESPQICLRLDANGGLTVQEGEQWLMICEGKAIEYLEQPVKAKADLLYLADQHYSTPLALDESMTSLKHLQHWYQNEWPGIFVIKPSIFGSVTQFQSWYLEHPCDVVFSSAIESSVGQYQVIQWIRRLWPFLLQHRAVGFGVNHLFPADEIPDPCTTPLKFLYPHWQNLWQKEVSQKQA